MTKTILIADDDEQLTESLVRALGEYRVLTARDGKAALALATAEKPDLVLLDVTMPELNGLQVLERLAAMPRKPLVIMLTGDESTDTISAAMSIGLFSYLIKPFGTDDLLEQVRRALKFAK